MATETISGRFQLELSSPEKRYVNKQVFMVTVPGSDGLYTVLPGHAPMVTTMNYGLVEVYANDDKTITDRVFVTGGYAEVTDSGCVILADEAYPTSELKRAELESEVKSIESELATNDNIDERELLEYKLTIANAKLSSL